MMKSKKILIFMVMFFVIARTFAGVNHFFVDSKNDATDGHNHKKENTVKDKTKAKNETHLKKYVAYGKSKKSAVNKKTKKYKGRRKFKVALDAGHSSIENLKMERIGPDTRKRKYKGAIGTRGVATGVPEYKLNLVIAKKLEKELIARGYDVYMVRRINKVDLGCKKRAMMINASGADICIRIHADSAPPRVHGACALYKTKPNSYATRRVNSKSKKLSYKILKYMCKSTKAYNRGLFPRNDLTGNNWSKIPTTLIEMGFMSNRAEDRKMQRKKYQRLIVIGIANGIDKYYRSERR